MHPATQLARNLDALRAQMEAGTDPQIIAAGLQLTHAVFRIRTGFASIIEAGQRLGRMLDVWAISARATARLARLERRRSAIGGNGSDAHHDLWQSASCGAWLHDSCPSDREDLYCSCRCHQ